MTGREIRWGILGAASIAGGQFLPGLREAGGGRAVLVGSRDRARARAFAAEQGVDEGVEGYSRVIESPDIDAVYVALPNSEHAEWTIRALRAGKAVLCEKPLCISAGQTAELLAAAAAIGPALLWEAFVFPFQPQHQRIVALLADGAIGRPAEIVSAFHFRLTRTVDIRLSAELGGGALADVGCYPIRLAHELFGVSAAPAATAGSAVVDGEVEVDAAAIASWDTRRLLLTCGFRRGYDTFTRILGDEGWLHVTNPFHPGPSDSIALHRAQADPLVEHPTTDARSFTAALRHIHAVLHGAEPARHTAAEYSLPAARTLEAVRTACGLH
jgi:predicted dehydrogenase